ncbi:MAG: hypothetical protein KAS63_05980 [Candidatus Heimdallarchaeota archaeon]|nr:hypothetical protein [Candidatus Heimdallarchaeota archaeon]MCK4954889.1 hypothetical protein [Candidatus Heimdallarchaeota archaeon]
MSSDMHQYKDNLYSFHIIEEGVSVHNEKFTDFLNIDDILVFGFISALYNYTYSIGKEEVKSIDFGSGKFLFEPLHDGRLLVVITKESLAKEKENRLLKSIKMSYEIQTQNKAIEDIESLLDIKEKFIPLDLVAEIRKKGQKGQNKSNIFVEDDLVVFPTISIPDVKVEDFYIESLMNEEILTSKAKIQIRKTLSNFFLGYKQLLASLFVIVKNELLTSFIFSRKRIDEIFPLIQYVLANPSISESELEKETYQIQQMNFENQKIWISTHASDKYAARVIFFSLSKDELLSMQRHLTRIMYFINKII